MMQQPGYDIVIVGGGMAGVYTAWRLVTSNLDDNPVLGPLARNNPNGRLKIALCERTRRVGGRIDSLVPPGMPHLRAEIGGMRYLTTQKIVRSLIEDELKLQYKTFYTSEDENILYLRGHHLREQDFTDISRVPYDLTWLEQGKKPDDLIVQAIETIVPNARKLMPEQWMEIKKTFEFDGFPLYQLGFWNLLLRVTSAPRVLPNGLSP